MRIVQISDTHLSVKHGHFARNADIIAASVMTANADLIIHTGDVSMDGALDVHDLELARRWNDQLPVEVLSIPGNHDVGDLPTFRPDQPLNDNRLSAWRRVMGADRWIRACNGWTLIGLNSMLLGTGHPQEEEQFEWLASVLADDQPIALFTHKPLCIEELNEGPRGYWTIAPEPRARLAALLSGMPVKLISSGHLHIQRKRVIDGVEHVWCPASSFVVGDQQEDLGGVRQLGYLMHTFAEHTVSSQFIRPDGLEDLLLDPVRHEIYAG